MSTADSTAHRCGSSSADMPDIVFKYDSIPTVKAFSQSDKFIRGLMGPFGSAKSSGCVMEVIKRGAAQKPGPDGIRRSRFAVIRNTYPQLRDTTIKTFHNWLPPAWFGDWRTSDHDYIINKLAPDLHIEVMFRALDRPEQVSNLLSLELTGAWVNEAREVPYAVIKAIQGRVGRYPAINMGGPTWWGVFMDTNPPDDDSWWYELFENKKPDNAQIFKQPSGTSPEAENLPNLVPNYYKNLLTSLDEEEAKVYVHGQYGYIKDGKPVYPEYNDNMHCSDKAEYVRGLPIYRGWDFGLTPACVFSQMHTSGRWVTFDELTADSLGIDRFSDAVLEHSGQNYEGATFYDVADPAGSSKAQTDERTCFEIMRGKGINVEPGDQTPTIRIESVKKPLRTLIDGKPQMMLHPRCKVLRRGYQGRYQYRRVKIAGAQERYHDVPDKNEYSHPHDANQYTATRLFGSALKSQNLKVAALKYPKVGIV